MYTAVIFPESGKYVATIAKPAFSVHNKRLLVLALFERRKAHSDLLW
jgi:hypothetical protein